MDFDAWRTLVAGAGADPTAIDPAWLQAHYQAGASPGVVASMIRQGNAPIVRTAQPVGFQPRRTGFNPALHGLTLANTIRCPVCGLRTFNGYGHAPARNDQGCVIALLTGLLVVGMVICLNLVGICLAVVVVGLVVLARALNWIGRPGTVAAVRVCSDCGHEEGTPG